MIDVEIYHEDEDSAYYYMKGKKPPVPLFAQRENIVEIFKLPNGAGEGKHLICGLGRTHPNKPIGTGFFDLVRSFIYFTGVIIEPIDHANPSAGTKLTQVNAFDLNGNIPDGM